MLCVRCGLKASQNGELLELTTTTYTERHHRHDDKVKQRTLGVNTTFISEKKNPTKYDGYKRRLPAVATTVELAVDGRRRACHTNARRVYIRQRPALLVLLAHRKTPRT